jgi:hypothetical protein
MTAVQAPTCGPFSDAADRVREHQKEQIGSAEEWRRRAAGMLAEAKLLDRPFQTLKRRRLEHEAGELEVRALRLKASLDTVDDRIQQYADAFAAITTSNVREACEVPAPPEDEPGELLPGAVAPAPAPSHDGSVNFQQWLDQRDVSTVKENLVAEMIQEIIGDVAKPKVQNASRCGDCNRDLVLSTVKAMLVCTSCGTAQPHLDATPSCVAYDEGGRREMYSNFSYTYKRTNHLFERIAQLQADSAPEVTPELLTQISVELHQRRIPIDKITTTLVKEILKKLKCREAYEHVVLITCRLQGQPTPVFTRETLEKLRRMFDAVQRPFERHCPPDRNNFLSYLYTLYKFLELLGAYSLLPFFCLLKGAAKLRRQDSIWRKICEDLGWEFIPSI